jgi:uncharacterized phage protein gp47/JayE
VPSSFLRNFNDILYQVLTDYSNLDSAPDVSQGSSPYITGSVIAAAAWSIYKYQDYILKQRFISEMDTESLDKKGAELNIARSSGETDAAYAARLLAYVRQPPAGGNLNDFQTWALDSVNSRYPATGSSYYWNYKALVLSQDTGPGTVGIYTIPNDETIVNNGANTYEEDLRSATQDYINSVRPAGMQNCIVNVTDPLVTSITVEVSPPSGETLDTDDIKTEIQSMIREKGPGESLFWSDITYVCRNYGAAQAEVTLPAVFETTATKAQYHRDYGGTVTVTEV